MKSKAVLQLIWTDCPKCNSTAEAVIRGQINKRNKFKEETVKIIGWNCKVCGFKKKAKEKYKI